MRAIMGIAMTISQGANAASDGLITFPLRPRRARILNAFADSSDGKIVLKNEALNGIICLAHPSHKSEYSDYNKRQHRPSRPLGSLIEEAAVWWSVEDGVVDFQDPRDRFFLGGREVESYECL